MRRNGNGPSYPIPVWNGILEHRARVGAALWVFLWLLDKITSERNGLGLVLGGKPVRTEEIAADLKEASRTVKRHLKQLRLGGYIHTTRTPFGLRIQVANSRKFSKQRWDKSGTSDRTKVALHGDKSGTNKEDLAVDLAVEEAVPPPKNRNPEPLHRSWEDLGVSQPIGFPWFSDFWESSYGRRPSGEQLSATMERCIVEWQKLGKKVPRPFYEAKRAVETQEQRTPSFAPLEIVRLPSAPPFQKRQAV